MPKTKNGRQIVNITCTPDKQITIILNGKPLIDESFLWDLVDLTNSSIDGAEQHHFALQDIVNIMNSKDDPTRICKEDLDIEFDMLLFLNKLKTFAIQNHLDEEDDIDELL